MKTNLLLKRHRCSLGHMHEYYCVGEIIDPSQCPTAYLAEIKEINRQHEISSRISIQQEKMIELKKSKTPQTPSSKEQQMKTHHNLHNDSRPTIVLIGEKFYDLVVNNWTKNQLLKANPKERPHVRLLNPIPDRSKGEQELRNEADEFLHELYAQIPQQNQAKEIKEKIKAGIVNPSDEVERLEALKLKAKKDGNVNECRRIRKLLRKIDYKRNINQTKEE